MNASYFRGLEYLKREDFDSAIKFFQKTISEKPDFAFAYHYLGEAYFHSSQIEPAEKAFLKASELNPHFLPTLLYLGKIAEQAGDVSKKEELYEKAFRQKGNSAKELKQLAQTLIKIGDADHPTIFNMYFEAHQKDPQNFETFLEIAEIYPPNPAQYTRFGEYLAQTEKVEQAIFFLQTAAHLEPENKEIWIKLADVLNKSGDPESAKICRRRAENAR